VRGRKERTAPVRARDDVLEIEERNEKAETHTCAALRVEPFDDADLVREGTREDTHSGPLLDGRLGIDVDDRRGRAACAKRGGEDGTTRRHGAGRGGLPTALGVGFAFDAGRRRRVALDELDETARVFAFAT
jgi:hypothetical protein